MVNILLYDGTYEGLFSVFFDCYKEKYAPVSIQKERNYQPAMFDHSTFIPTELVKSDRVMKGLRKKLSSTAFSNLTKAFFSEFEDIEMTIYEYVQLVFNNKMNIEKDYRQSSVLRISQVTKKVNREIHRMHAFVRFQKTTDNIYAATIRPDFDVIPFIGSHFKERYADQLWMIYDTKRDYGLFYDLTRLDIIRLENPEWEGNKKIKRTLYSNNEIEFQTMWKNYFRATSISERKNMKLHLQHMPRKYWHYLPEKQMV
ncbi:DNA metabolism protein [Fulvivirga sp. M361]|uniref:TIGR03915 family putative DNA repair protein n=1 Tax=Fulvivirga sp. M361 TaxID=2594266 RepID=UPI00117B865A|nr:TIGR03915 family putative DNA repair protein [Fulvivirga sp. M361]TRX55945.1 DNA metabolism protein [Fulvivirga sp. M361]